MVNFKSSFVKVARSIRKFLRSCTSHMNQYSVASMYIKGSGIEIGALHNPLRITSSAKVKYVDRMTITELRKQYPELDTQELVDIDIIDDGEQLTKIIDSTQDFVIANHFLEHCQNPIGAIRNMLRVLKQGGILYLSIPDKRYSFDTDRPITSIDHLLKDYYEDPEWSKRQHLEEWVKHIDKIKDDAEAEQRILHLMNLDYSIHYHAWTQTEMLELIVTLKKRLQFNFEVALICKNMGEVIIILRKND